MHERARIPEFGPGGYTLYASEDFLVHSCLPSAIPTGLKMSFPPTHCALITRHKLKTLAGLVDSDYRGEVKVIVISKEEVKIKAGDPIARLQMLEIECPEVEVEQGYPTDFKQQPQ
ncbi:DUT [Enterospora canceri]|uniref:Deoxyuridine 5'-triphosphate nucleotidohydrolase n=1 Tax=Enterospora canceri TaxID=1081671 RepID=A0A1Y1S5L1_9MICR|nr:DUT [Enterospora canceri]